MDYMQFLMIKFIEEVRKLISVFFLIFYLKMNDHELIKLKKELQRKQELLKEQRQDRQNTQKTLVTVQAERDRYHSQLVIARQSIENVNLIIEQNIRELKSKMEQQHSQSFQELQRLKDKVIQEKMLRERIEEQLRNKQTVISELSLRLREMSRKYKDPSLLVNTKEVADQAAITNNNYYKLTQKYNKLCSDMQNILAQNKILRKLHRVPQNFGFDLQQIKIAQKQELEDYKAQCRKLQSQIQELQAERTQLRYRLRQYNTLYSNKGERYKDLTQQQMQMLDLYALNLKEGKIELPQIDKSQKQMQRQIIKLKAQIEVLQNKSVPSYQHKPMQNEGQKISIEALNKMEQQISKLINPIRDQMKKIAQMKVIYGDENQSRINHNMDAKFDGPQYRPPMPLPHSHNDWTHIKEGFSYLYNSKIPIEFKDLMDQTGFNIAKAKYEIAALQLQNIQSLKLLKEKQTTENKLYGQVNELRLKYQKCIKIQDELFLKYFKEKEQVNGRIKQLQIEKYNLNSQKQVVQNNLATISASFNALTKKTDIQKKIAEFTSRLALDEAELIKLRRKYQVLTGQHKLLRASYSSLESKTASNQYNLKQKIALTKKNEKELTFYLNKILNDSKQSVSGDIHNILLNKMQCLNDKTLNNSIKETELRLRINKLQNIEREINLKDDVIETLRQDNFDINMELEIIKNRLQSIDKEYQAFQNVFRRLIKFINQNNISMVTYFKKFDKDGSGQLSKNQFLSAIKALGFEITNHEFELLFSEFDLDGSSTITYKQFFRKLRRSGVSTKNKQQQSIYKLFKAIKQANISVRKAYQIIDMDGSNSISKSEMETAFRKIGIDISMNTIDYIFKMCDDDQSGKIQCSQFQKLFEDIVRQSVIQEKELFSTELDWKLGFLLKMEQISNKYHKGGLKQTFNSLDKDGNKCMTMNQLTEFFKQCGIELPKKQQLQLFEFLDRERDGKIQYLQFLKVLQQARNQKKRIDRLRYIKIRTEQLRKQNQINSSKQIDNNKLSQQRSLAIKMMALQTKHSSLLKKSQKLIKAIAVKEQQLIDSKKQIEQYEQNVLKIQGQYYKQKQLSINFAEKIKNRISEEESKILRLDLNKMQISYNQIAGQLELYKKLYESLTNKNKYDEMRIVKTESELQKYLLIVKQLQSVSDLNAEIGKKIYELQISKRNQQVINKKNQQLIEQIRSIHSQNIKLSEQSIDKERQIINIHYFAQQKSQLMQRNIDELNGKILPTVNPHKIQEILLRIREISNSKTALQKQNKELRQLNFNIQIKNDYLQNQKLHVQELQRKLKRSYGDQSSITIIELTKKLSQYKMAELKAKRQCGLLKQKQEYFLRVNNAHMENIKELQQELAGWQKKYNERQQFWRKSKAQQMKLMQDIQKEVTKNKQQQRKAQVYFKQQEIQDNKIDQMISNMPEQKQVMLSSVIRRTNYNPNEGAVFQLKGKIQELEQQLLIKQKQIYQLKTSFKEIVPEMKLSDFSGQMGASTANFVMQTQLTTSQLRNNARRFINNQKDQQNYYKQEALKVTQAAQQSIDTLQRIIDDKNDQLRRKDQVIENLKKEFLRNKEQDCKQIQLLNQQIRQLKTKVQTTSINQIMSRPTRQNFYPNSSKNDEVFQLRKYIDKKQEQIKILQQKYDKLYINKQKNNNVNIANNQRLLQKQLNELQEDRQVQKKRYYQNQQMLKQKISNLQKLSKQKDLKLARLNKTILDIKNQVVYESSKAQSNEIEEQLKDAVINLTKGKTANDSKMQITLQKSLQTIQQLTKKNKQYQQEIRRLKQEKFAKTSFKK